MKTTQHITRIIHQKYPLIKPYIMEKNSTISYTHLIHKVYNPTNSNIMKQKTKVSETVPAGEVAVENVILFNHSNLNKMRTTKKVSSRLLVFFAAFLMAAGVAKAQEKTVKSADAMEVVSAVPASAGISASLREVKPDIEVPEKLVKAMRGAKRDTYGSKKVKSNEEKTFQTRVYRWYELTPTSSIDTTFQILASGTPLTVAPPNTNSTECAKTLNTGNFCAVLIEFPSGTTGSDLNLPSGSVKNAIDMTVALRVATGVTAQDPDGNGYSRLPLP